MAASNLLWNKMSKTYLVYLIHFEPQYKHAGHYIGMTQDLPARLKRHLQGTGGNLPYVAHKSGSMFLVKILSYGLSKNEARELEILFKARKNSRKLCPFCLINQSH